MRLLYTILQKCKQLFLIKKEIDCLPGRNYLKAISINRIVWKKNPTEFDTMYRLSLLAIARNKKKNSPTHIMTVISIGGILSALPRMILIETGMVEDWIKIIPIQPPNSDIF